MKRKTLLSIILFILLITYSSLTSKTAAAANEPSLQGNLTVYSVPSLRDLAYQWTGEYTKQNPGLKIDVRVIPEAVLFNNLKTSGGLGLVYNETPAPSNQDQIWKVIIGRNVIVPAISSKNPFLDEISKQGISPALLSKSLENPATQQWGTFLKGEQKIPVHFYILNDVSVKSGLSDYLNVSPEKMMGISVTNEEGMIRALENDPYAIGFCRLTTILDQQNQTITENIRLLPLDKNGNGKMDYMEKIYTDLQDFSRGVWIGKYPKELSRELFFVSAGQPKDANEAAFLTWILTDGQELLASRGYCDLVYNERQSQLDKVGTPGLVISPVKNSYALARWIALGVVMILVAGFVVSVFLSRRGSKRMGHAEGIPGSPQIFDEHTVDIPGGLYYDKTHTWAFMDEEGLVKIGIDDFLQHITGPITRIEMKNPGEKIRKGEQLLSIIQNGKQLHLYAPVSGTIKEQNTMLTSHSSYLNASPYYKGWVYMIEPTNWPLETQFLTMAGKYKTWLHQEFSRLKDFLATSLQSDQLAYSHVVLQDGGALKDGVLIEFGPELWEEFQRKFIDVSR